MHEFFIHDSHESIGLGLVYAKCPDVANGHKHDPHVIEGRACVGYPAQLLFSLERPNATG